MPLTTLPSLFAHKAWSNDELFTALAAVGDQQADQRRRCIRTLNHIYVVDRIFQAHLSGERRPFDATNTPETPTLAQLRRDVAATDAWYLQYVSGLSATEAAEVINFHFTDGDAGRMSREEMLMHVITHGGYHRGAVGQMLGALDLPVPRDLYTKFLHQAEPGRRSQPG
ncbi:MAG: DinB family protein [Aquincola sp.]|uniref:DinB family protein n=1 Tax=uncultured Aquincola sp. TaxID=886556 RepID=UPI0032B210A7|nr:DinB family protein [Aquincola sp.]|tara:strand:+ start:305 stop:811 length:507 start_codon:yes stop_codon:yes gene_type:complete